MGSKADKLILTILALIVIGGALYLLVDEYGAQKFIEGQRNCEGGWIHIVTFSTIVDLQFHSKNALGALDSNSTAAFNLSMVELQSDFLRLLNHLIETESYLELDMINNSVLEMTDTGQCIDFLNEWRENSNYPSEDLLEANAELQQKCAGLIQRVETS